MARDDIANADDMIRVITDEMPDNVVSTDPRAMIGTHEQFMGTAIAAIKSTMKDPDKRLDTELLYESDGKRVSRLLDSSVKAATAARFRPVAKTSTTKITPVTTIRALDEGATPA